MSGGGNPEQVFVSKKDAVSRWPVSSLYPPSFGERLRMEQALIPQRIQASDPERGRRQALDLLRRGIGRIQPEILRVRVLDLEQAQKRIDDGRRQDRRICVLHVRRHGRVAELAPQLLVAVPVHQQRHHQDLAGDARTRLRRGAQRAEVLSERQRRGERGARRRAADHDAPRVSSSAEDVVVVVGGGVGVQPDEGVLDVVPGRRVGDLGRVAVVDVEHDGAEGAGDAGADGLVRGHGAEEEAAAVHVHVDGQ